MTKAVTTASMAALRLCSRGTRQVCRQLISPQRMLEEGMRRHDPERYEQYRLIECIFWLPFIQRPRFLAHSASECPSLEELRRDLILLAIRGGYLNWAHLSFHK